MPRFSLHHTRRCATFLLAFSLLLLMRVGVESGAATPKHTVAALAAQKPMQPQPFVSLFSVCNGELKQYCASQPTATLKCLLRRYAFSLRRDVIPRPPRFSEGCSNWLSAREKCVRAVRHAGTCAPSESASECLRRFPQHLLPDGCRGTTYYESVKLYGELRRQREGE